MHVIILSRLAPGWGMHVIILTRLHFFNVPLCQPGSYNEEHLHIASNYRVLVTVTNYTTDLQLVMQAFVTINGSFHVLQVVH